MSKIVFYDAPAGISSKSAANKHKTARSGKKAIIKEWNKWLSTGTPIWPKPTLLNTVVSDLSIALVADNLSMVPYKSCARLMQSFTKSNGTSMQVLPEMKNASVRLKSMASELVAIAATIHTAQKSGLIFCGSRSDINTIFETEVWNYRWPLNHGPDYLFTDEHGNVTFVEVKGEVFDLDSIPLNNKLNGFAEHKIQSINARLTMPWGLEPPPSIRYVLSRVRHDSNDTITVRWFNHREINRQRNRDCDAIVLATALSNYRQILRSLFGSYDIKFSPSTIDSYAMATEAATQHEKNDEFGFVAYIPYKVIDVFYKIEKEFEGLNKYLKNYYNGGIIDGYMEKLKYLLLSTLSEHTREEKIDNFSSNQITNLNWLPMGIVVYDRQPIKPD